MWTLALQNIMMSPIHWLAATKQSGRGWVVPLAWVKWAIPDYYFGKPLECSKFCLEEILYISTLEIGILAISVLAHPR